MAKQKIDETAEVRDSLQRIFPNAQLRVILAPGRRRGEWWVGRVKYRSFDDVKMIAGGGKGTLVDDVRLFCKACAVPELEVLNVHLVMKCGRVLKEELAEELRLQIWGDPNKHYRAMLNELPCPIQNCRWCGGRI